MHYALNFRTFLFSHYFYAGLRTAVGVTGTTALVYAVSDIMTAVTVGLGAFCTSLMDMPGTLRQKFNEMLACAVLCSLVALVISLAAPVLWLSVCSVLAVSFLASMTVAYGRRAMPLQFAALFIMVLSMDHAVSAHQGLVHGTLVLIGGISYLAYAITVGWFLRTRTQQQILAEALFELARCISTRAGFYRNNVDISNQFSLLTSQQSIVTEKQQVARDILLSGNHSEKSDVFLRVHFVTLDLFEALLSNHNDYALLHRSFADHQILTYLHDMISKAAGDVESIAYDITRNRMPGRLDYQVSYEGETREIIKELAGLEREVAAGRVSSEAYNALLASWNKAFALVSLLGRLHAATIASNDPMPMDVGVDMTAFMTQQKYEMHLLWSNFRWTSPVFRFAIRITLAMATCLLVAKQLPYASHAYWLMLTIAVILKPSFSMTKQRRTDRVTGTLIGCVLAALILYYVRSPIALLGVLFAATVASIAFVQVKYRFTAIAASLHALILISLLTPAVDQVILERISDTIIGAVIATAFSFVLPSWEYRELPRLVGSVIRSAHLYVEASCDLLQGVVIGDFHYRLSRKRLTDSLSGLSSALTRMLDEPAHTRRASESMNLLIIQNYLLVAHVTEIRRVMRVDVTQAPGETAKLVDGIRKIAGDVLSREHHVFDHAVARSSEDIYVIPSMETTRSVQSKGMGREEEPDLISYATLILADIYAIAMRGEAIDKDLLST
jgi:uncharacterized membrane protein YccC